MKPRRIWLVHVLFCVLLALIALPDRRVTDGPICLLAACCIAEGLCIWKLARHPESHAAGDLGALFMGGLCLWELFSTVLNVAHPILIPTPEGVFHVFADQWVLMLRGVGSTLSLLALGFGIALPAGTLLGMYAARNRRLGESLVPLARVMAPIPAMIYAPYLVALMPTFRAASAMILVLGIFWPTFLQTVGRVRGMDPSLIDSARTLCLSQREMILQICLPALLPGLLASLRVTLSTSFMLLTLAEMMGATSGLGYFIKNYADYANYTNVLAGILLVALVVTGLNYVVTKLERF